MGEMVHVLDWLNPTVAAADVSNLQYALSTMAQSYAAVLGILLTVGLAFAQLGDYRIPLVLLARLSLGEMLALLVAVSAIVVPVVALSFDLLELYRLSFLLFVAGILLLPAFVVRMTRRGRPAFYVRRLKRARRGFPLYEDSVVSLAIQAADKRDWEELETMTALLGQLRRKTPLPFSGRGLGYQNGLPRVFHHLVDTDNNRGIRTVLRALPYGSTVFLSASLDRNERGWFSSFLRRQWSSRPAWVHRRQFELRNKWEVNVRRSYDYDILMGLTQSIQELVNRKTPQLGDTFIPKRVSEFKEWAQLVCKVMYSVYLLDELSASDSGSSGEMYQAKMWAGLLGTVSPQILRDVIRGIPHFPGHSGIILFPLRYPDDLKAKLAKEQRLSWPARIRAANRLTDVAIEKQLDVNGASAESIFWPVWEMSADGKPWTFGKRP